MAIGAWVYGQSTLRESDPNRHPPRRWVVDGGHAWFNRFRGVLIRSAQSAQSYLGCVQLAACLIVGRKLLLFSG